MELTLSVPFGYEPNEEVRKLLEDFKDMVNFCIDVAVKNHITSYFKLRKLIYEECDARKPPTLVGDMVSIGLNSQQSIIDIDELSTD